MDTYVTIVTASKKDPEIVLYAGGSEYSANVRGTYFLEEFGRTRRVLLQVWHNGIVSRQIEL